jgi:endonuclease/exonuclease/phosphatase family metal-dependent hydrolase
MGAHVHLDPTAAAGADEILVATWNVEALFDTKKDAGTLDDEYLPHGWYAWTEEKLARKIANLGRVVRAIGGGRGPDVLALEEVENLGIVERLRDEALADLGYQAIVHFETEDLHGLDNAILSRFPVVGTPKNHETSRMIDRDRLPRGILDATFDVHGVHLIVFVNHWPAGPKADGQRMHVASILRKLIEERRAADPGAEVLVVGDFNVGPADRALGERGLRTTLDAEAARSHGGELRLYNTMAANVEGTTDATALERLVKDTRRTGLGTHFTRPYPYTGPDGEWNAFDQVFVSGGLLDDVGLSWVQGSTRVLRLDFMLEADGTPRGFFERGVKPKNQDLDRTGFSDHLPVVTRLQIRR